jgi:hypothetical protein
MENRFSVSQITCAAKHTAVDQRFSAVDKENERQWETIEGIRKSLQKQAVQVATIVGGVSALVQAIAIFIQIQFK